MGSRRNSRPLKRRVEFTPEQESILEGVSRETSRPSDVWLKDQIKWRKELVERYNSEIADLEKRLQAALGVGPVGEGMKALGDAMDAESQGK
jgi:hypothetical protein